MFTTTASRSGRKRTSSGSSSGAIVQIINTETGAVATGATTIPVDDTIPQNTEGTEFMTLAITPTDANNTLRIDVVCNLTGANLTIWLIAALFQDSTANALAVGMAFTETNTAGFTVVFSYYMIAGTTSSTTFKVRAGSNAGATVTFNGQGGARLFGGVLLSSITITEIAA